MVDIILSFRSRSEVVFRLDYSVHTPNGIANVGDGYRATPDGKYLYGEGLQPKRWNPNLEIGGIVRRGGCSIPRRWADFGDVLYRAVGKHPS